MPNFFTNQDDAISDPDMIFIKTLVGRSPYFEVQLTLDELSERLYSLGGSSPTILTASLGYSGGGGLGGPPVGCPREDQLIPTDRGLLPAIELTKDKTIRVFDPLFNIYNAIEIAEVRHNAPMVEIRTKNGISTCVSNTHLVLTGIYDNCGKSIRHLRAGDEVLTYDLAQRALKDTIQSIDCLPAANIVYLELANRHIYVTSTDGRYGLCAHNSVKPLE